MAGMMPDAAPALPPAAAGAAPSPTPEQAADTVSDNEDATEDATPEEQEQYDAFVKGALKLVADQGESILDLLDNDPTDLKEILGDAGQFDNITPPLALAATTVIVVMEAIRRSGEKPADDVLMHGGKEVLEVIAELAEKAGEQEYSQDQLNQAWLMGLDLYRSTAEQEGMIDDNALKAQFDEIVTADKEGRLDSVLPAMKGAQVQEPAAEEEAAPEAAPAPAAGGMGNGGLR
jgi:hypothetical protein